MTNELGYRIIDYEDCDSYTTVIFVPGSWEIGNNQRNSAASDAIIRQCIANTLFYESTRDWDALDTAATREDWIGAFDGKTFQSELADLKAVIDQERKEPNIGKIYLSGSSYGGALAIMASDLVDGMLLAAPQISCNPGENPPNIYQDFPTLETLGQKLAAFQGPLSIVHGQEDNVIPIDSSFEAYMLATGTRDKRFTIIPGNHTFTDNLTGYAREHLHFLRR
tara:strand:+ start:1180 stop:1848 length:669 start_codon:yes stop_codon:yes gene_type:complete